MTSTPPDRQPGTGERNPATSTGSPPPALTCLHVTGVDEADGTLSGHWLHADDWPGLLRPGGVLLTHRTTPATAGRSAHRTVSLYHWTGHHDHPLLKLAEWCRLDHTWRQVIAPTVAYWLTHHAD
jgi:hypothetical protein